VTVFEQLGRLVREEWRQAEFDSRTLPDIACRALDKNRLADRVRPEQIVQWVADTPVLPPQGDLRSTFGQPPLVVYQDPRFYIEVLFWTTLRWNVRLCSGAATCKRFVLATG
jgi:hypothetical protein